MSNKRFFITIFVVFFILNFIWCFIVYDSDYIFKFKSPKGEYSISNEIYQNSGIANNFTYDSAIIGSSMTENFKPSTFELYFKTYPIKLSYSGSNSYNIELSLSQIFNSKNDVKKVFISLDDYMLFSATEDFYPFIPSYVYEKNLESTFQYLYNKNLFMELNSSFNENKSLSPMEFAYNWNDEFEFSKENCLAGYSYYEDTSNYQIFNGDSRLIVDQNLSRITKYISDNPNCQFYIFFPPYSMAQWFTYSVGSGIDYEIDLQKFACEKLLKFENVKLYYFQDNLDIVTNLNNYKDLGHYCEDINVEIVKLMADNNSLLTTDNYQDILDNWRITAKNYDYKEMFED
ncbi:hypothetical protein HNQ43_000005 [Faecalicoccus acidiformans]|uniref:Uncharacterized protein n=1 Tax=Faecalicoccus acidiformans TaxID=915173 RepID=A0A7W8CYK2_9FIRM|nr:hypothetical protein [Faecalicoccus acidiformans]MBB5183972.1 hypothetical protein [Faecalicoccus acidiformans]